MFMFIALIDCFHVIVKENENHFRFQQFRTCITKLRYTQITIERDIDRSYWNNNCKSRLTMSGMIKIHSTSLITIFILSWTLCQSVSYILATPTASADISIRDKREVVEEGTSRGCMVTGLLGKKCRGSYQCEQDQWCYGYKCEDPCPRLNCQEHLPPDGQCVVRDHLPVCKSPAQLQEEQAIRENSGCVTSSDCSALQWCKEGVCEAACPNLNCKSERVDGYCEVINHHPICKPTTDLDMLPLSDNGDDCTNSFDCHEHLSCFEGKCSDPCSRLWCFGIKGDAPPGLTPEQEFLIKINKDLKEPFECVVWNRLADCIIKHSSEPEDFEESEA